MTHFIHDDWHGWQGSNAFLLSDEKVKRLHSFKDTDDLSKILAYLSKLEN